MADLDGDGLVTFDEFLKYHALLKEHGAEMSAEAEMVRLLRDCSELDPSLGGMRLAYTCPFITCIPTS